MRRTSFLRCLSGFTLIVLLPALLEATLEATCEAENWSQFRGDDGTGRSTETQVRSEWSAGQIAWTVELPGVGHSSPVIWGNKLFLTSANDTGTTRYVLCLDAASGKVLWKRQLEFSRGHKHPKNSWASSTPALDGERVYVVFADSDRQIVTAYDFEGTSVWEQNLGGFKSQHAQGTSPIVFEDLVILANDQDGPSFIVALDKLTGHIVWKVPRKSAAQATSYATPFLYRPAQGPPQLICSSSQSGLSALDPHTGQTIWTTESFPQRTVGSPVLAGGLLFQCCGAAGQGMLMIAVDPGGQGDVSKTRVRYKRTRLLPYVPTPVACGKYLFLWSDHGVVCCTDPATGKDVWTKRVGGDFSSSPICAGGELFNIDETGNVVVVAAAPEFKLLGKFPLGDPSHSTPAVANGRLYFRTFHHLACVAARP